MGKQIAVTLHTRSEDGSVEMSQGHWAEISKTTTWWINFWFCLFGFRGSLWSYLLSSIRNVLSTLEFSFFDSRGSWMILLRITSKVSVSFNFAPSGYFSTVGSYPLFSKPLDDFAHPCHDCPFHWVFLFPSFQPLVSHSQFLYPALLSERHSKNLSHHPSSSRSTSGLWPFLPLIVHHPYSNPTVQLFIPWWRSCLWGIFLVLSSTLVSTSSIHSLNFQFIFLLFLS